MTVPRFDGGACGSGAWPLDMWSSRNVTDGATARHVCRQHCPIAEHCLRAALANRPSGGVMGGVQWTASGRLIKASADAPETCWVCRPELHRPAAGRARQPCGTRAAHDRHRAHGEAIDAACKDAYRAYHREEARERRARKAAV